MAHLLTQPKQKLQLNYKTIITQNHQKIEHYGSPTTRGLKEVTFIQMGRRGRDGKMQNGQSHTHVWWIKVERDPGLCGLVD